MEKKMEATIYYLGFRVWGLGSRGLSNNGKENGSYYISFRV